MFCVHCGKALPDTARFCYACGKPLAPSEGASDAPSVSRPPRPSSARNLEAPTPTPPPVQRRSGLFHSQGFQFLLPLSILAILVVLAPEIVKLAMRTARSRPTAPSASLSEPVPTPTAPLPTPVPHPGFKARFECSMMGQPTALAACIETSSISVVTDRGVREFNLMTLPGGGASSFLDVDLPEHFKIRAPNISTLPLALRLTVRELSGRVVFSDAAGPGRSVNVEN